MSSPERQGERSALGSPLDLNPERTHMSRAWNAAENDQVTTPTSAKKMSQGEYGSSAGANCWRLNSRYCACGARFPTENTVEASSCIPRTRTNGHLPWYFVWHINRAVSRAWRCRRTCSHSEVQIHTHRLQSRRLTLRLHLPHARVLTVICAGPSKKPVGGAQLFSTSTNNTSESSDSQPQAEASPVSASVAAHTANTDRHTFGH
jgi:hypothetical protein